MEISSVNQSHTITAGHDFSCCFLNFSHKVTILVSIVAEEYADSRLSKDELAKAGMDGIANAQEKYDKENGFSFNAYAVWWVRQRIIQTINEKD